ncbi:MAG: acyl carrier protein [Tenericutes bacterium HGW-Tenericutes-4]|nr:MAG: acyl carrier protein [Tenericutes bacterium HGW-Tenericutes-4]
MEETIKMLAKKLNLPQSKAKSETRIIEDLGYDSLDTVEMIMTLEEEFDIRIKDEDAIKLKTLGDVANYIDNLNK